MLTALIDYESGNLHSALKAFEKISSENSLGSVTITNDPEIISNADRLVLPGDGAFPACKAALEKSEVFEALKHAVLAKRRPFLGICVGMQLMAKKGFEFEPTNGLNWINGQVERIQLDDPSLKIPHMGWNNVKIEKQHELFSGIDDKQFFYFVHSFVAASTETSITTTHYGEEFVSSLATENIFATQFHPEKSGKIGLKFLENFINWKI